ncbi:hypothetical protein [Roseovarius sp. CH_XMU1461]|uniref:hypothetical protein n=1 Tax=Roseovarius sp. CH_XMU1461 TaxID=3107777 RepID=UPI003008D128
MPVLSIDATPQGPQLHGADVAPSAVPSAAPGAALGLALDTALADPAGRAGPVIVLVHGYKYQPGRERHCPHRTLGALDPDCPGWVGQHSWPRGLGFGQGAEGEGVAISFGWLARGSLWQAYRRAGEAGRMLAQLVEMIRARAPGRPVHAVSHSLGARVVLSALAAASRAEAGFDRAILLSAAELRGPAARALATPAGRRAEVFNVTSRENDIFDLLFELVMGAPWRGERAMSEGIPEAGNLRSLQIDHADVRRALGRAGVPMSHEAAMACHWSTYTRPGLLGFYARLLREGGGPTLATLIDAVADQQDPRWSRLWRGRGTASPLGETWRGA